MRKQCLLLLPIILISSQLIAGHGRKNTQKPPAGATSQPEGQSFVQVDAPNAASPDAGPANQVSQPIVAATTPQTLEKTPQVKAGELNAEMAKWFWKGRRDLLQKLQKEYDPSRHVFGSPDQEETKTFIQETLKSLQYHQQYDDLAATLIFIEEKKLIDLDRSPRQSLRKSLKTALSSAQDTRKKALAKVITDQSKAVDEQIKKLSLTVIAADEALAKQNAQDTSVIQGLRKGLHATATLHKTGEAESDDEGELSSHYATPATLRTHLGIETTTLLSDGNRESLQKVLDLKLFGAQQPRDEQKDQGAGAGAGSADSKQW